MVQILQPQPSFIDQVAPHVDQLIQGLQKRSQDQKDEQILNELSQGKFASPIEGLTKAARLSPEKGKFVSEFLNNQVKQQNALETAKAKEEGKAQAEKQKTAEKAKGHLEIVKSLREKIPYVGNQFGTKTIGGPLRRETVQKRNQFNTEAIALEGLFRDLATKGTLPVKIFETLLDRLPNAELSERENLGRLDAIESILNKLNPEVKQAVKQEMQSSPSSSKKSLKDIFGGR